MDMGVRFDEIDKSLRDRQYAKVPFHVDQERIQQVMEAFFAFLTLPQEQKNELFFNKDPLERAGTGYVRRDKSTGDGDTKEFVHFHPSLFEECRDKSVLSTQIAKHFLEEADFIYRKAGSLCRDVIASFEPHFPGISEKCISSDGMPASAVLRFLKYEPAGKGNFLAHAHYDRGNMTFALAESAPGLRIGKNNETLQPVEHHEHEAIFMPAFRFGDITDNTYLPAWHDVVQASKKTYSHSAARWALVFFADTRDSVVPPTKEQCETPLV